MTTHTRSEDNRNHLPTSRIVYGVLLVLAVAALLIYAVRFAFPSGQTGIEAEPNETAPADQTPR